MAIAFDSATPHTADLSFTGSYTFSHTCTGSDRYLIVEATTILTTGGSVTGITYNGVSMSLLEGGSVNSGDYYTHVYGLANPASGSNNVVITYSSSDAVLATAISYTGVNQASPIDATALVTDLSASSPASFSITTTASNCWLVGFSHSIGGYPTASTGTTFRTNSSATDASASDNIYDSNAPLSPGSNSLTVTNTVDPDDYYVALIARAPAASAPSGNSNFLIFF